MPTVNEEIDHTFLKDVFDEGPERIGMPGEMERLMKAKRMLEGWKQSHDGTDPHVGTITIWIEEVDKLIDKNKNTAKAGRRRRNRKTRRRRAKTNSKKRRI